MALFEVELREMQIDKGTVEDGDFVLAGGKRQVVIVAAAVVESAGKSAAVEVADAVLGLLRVIVGEKSLSVARAVVLNHNFSTVPVDIQRARCVGQHDDGLPAVVGINHEGVVGREVVIDIQQDTFEVWDIRLDVPRVIGGGVGVEEGARVGGQRGVANGSLRSRIRILVGVGVGVDDEFLGEVEVGAGGVEVGGDEVAVVAAAPSEVEVVVENSVHGSVAVADEAVAVDVGHAPAGIVEWNFSFQITDNQTVPIERGGIAEHVLGFGRIFEVGAEHVGGAVVVHAGAVDSVVHIHAHAAVVDQFRDFGVDGGGVVAHGGEVVGGVAEVGRLGAVVLVGVTVGAGAGVGPAEVVHELTHGGGHAAGDAAVVGSGVVAGAVVVVELILAPVRVGEGFDGLAVAGQGALAEDVVPGGVFGAFGRLLQGRDLVGIAVEPHLGGRDDLVVEVELVVGEGEDGRGAFVAGDDHVAVIGVEDIEQVMAVAGGGVGGTCQLAVLALQEGSGDAGGLFGGDRLCPQGGQRQGQNEGAEEELFHNGMGIAVFQLYVVSFRKFGDTLDYKLSAKIH